ncbi:MAG: hypothetical protein ACYDCK_00565 [Thermoplasmatota archaeon]
MSLAKKLNIAPGMRLRIVGKPAGLKLDDLRASASPNAEAILVFVKTLAEVDEKCDGLAEAARADRIAWIAYPKAGQLQTDLNRDVLARHLQKRRIDPVRQVAINGVWSALRFRPGK